MHGLQSIVLKGLRTHRNDRLEQVIHRLRKDLDLQLRMRIKAQRKEVEDVVQIALPIPLGVNAHWKSRTRQFARHALLRQANVILIEKFSLLQELHELLSRANIDRLVAALSVGLGLLTHRINVRAIEAIRNDRVAR